MRLMRDAGTPKRLTPDCIAALPRWCGRAGDNVSTDDIIPAGVRVLPSEEDL
jgi:hypothetical protein